MRCKNTLIVRGKTSVNGGAFDGTKMHKKNIQKRVCDGVKKRKRHKNRHATRQVEVEEDFTPSLFTAKC